MLIKTVLEHQHDQIWPVGRLGLFQNRILEDAVHNWVTWDLRCLSSWALCPIIWKISESLNCVSDNMKKEWIIEMCVR